MSGAFSTRQDNLVEALNPRSIPIVQLWFSFPEHKQVKLSARIGLRTEIFLVLRSFYVEGYTYLSIDLPEVPLPPSFDNILFLSKNRTVL